MGKINPSDVNVRVRQHINETKVQLLNRLANALASIDKLREELKNVRKENESIKITLDKTLAEFNEVNRGVVKKDELIGALHKTIDDLNIGKMRLEDIISNQKKALKEDSNIIDDKSKELAEKTNHIINIVDEYEHKINIYLGIIGFLIVVIAVMAFILL